MKKVIGRFVILLGVAMLCVATFFLSLNIYESWRGGQKSDEILVKYDEIVEQKQETPLVIEETAEPVMEYIMETVEVDGLNILGQLSIPSLSLKLPIIADYSEENLKSAPSRYQGSYYDDDLIIAGHNYRKHFSGIKRMNIGDIVQLIIPNGTVIEYMVVSLEIIDGIDIESMNKGDWDLTLFTCTTDSKSRVAVRCDRITEFCSFAPA